MERIEMEKKYKPIPDVECLKYHGTPEKPDIKIFVSHRIDLDSEIIDNPLYIPVRCGAVYDERQNISMLGDDTGDNISDKRIAFCEYTVMYWAWKNIIADYYGLCHYRRYLSYSEIELEEWNEQRFYREEVIDGKSVERHNLFSAQIMRDAISRNDVTTSVTYETSNVPIVPERHTVRELFEGHPGLITSSETIERTCEIVKQKFSQYFDALNAELNSNLHRGFNCFVMRKELFNLMCEYLFGVLFELDALQEVGKLEKSNPREMGYIGEILYGSFIRWLYEQNCYQIKEQHIVLFFDTSKKWERKKKTFYKWIKNLLKQILPAYRCSLRIENKLQQQQLVTDRQKIEIEQLSQQLNSVLIEMRHLNGRMMNTFWTQPHDFKFNTDAEKLKFWSAYPKATGDLRFVQEANFLLLKRLKRICDSLKISFWLHGGSLIGGLRHAGFVPWDDDIDIAMMREDFDRLKSCLGENSTYGITEYYYIGIGTRSYRFRRIDMDFCFFVDIFVYDHYCLKTESELLDWRNLTQKKTHLIIRATNLCHDLQCHPSDPTLKDFSELHSALDRLINVYIARTQGAKSGKWILWGMDNNYEDSQAFAWNHGRIFLKDDIFPLTKCFFEGEEFFIPKNFEKYAFSEYGIRYVEIPRNMGDSIHMKEFFGKPEQIEQAKKLIKIEQEDS